MTLETTMKTILASLGLIGLLAATPAFAATASKKPVQARATHSTVCMVKGKRVTCPDHIVVRRHHRHHTARK
jgi:hypothetical protein